MKTPLGILSNIAASGSTFISGVIPLVRARTLSITTRLTCGGSIDADPQMDLFYSPDGQNWDTVAYTTWTMTFTASGTIQKTAIIDPPEHGAFRVKVTNKSAADVLTDVNVWYSIQAWPPEPSQSSGDLTKREPEF